MNQDPTKYHFRLRDSLLGAQMLFVAFGALVLVPILTGLDPNVALFTAGLGTLVFQIITKGKVPVFLASSFAFIAPIIYGVKTWGIPGTLCGLASAGVVYILLSILISFRGVQVLERLLPPIVTGPVIMVIGLILAPVAVNMAMGKTGDGSAILVPEKNSPNHCPNLPCSDNYSLPFWQGHVKAHSNSLRYNCWLYYFYPIRFSKFSACDPRSLVCYS